MRASPGIVPDAAADLVEGVSGPFHYGERIGHPHRTRAPGGDDGVDEVSSICAHVGDLGAALLTEEVKEGVHGCTASARRRPHQSAGVVIDHNHQVLVAPLVGDLVDPDPAEPGKAVTARIDIGPLPW